jgi:hypothetical protein
MVTHGFRNQTNVPAKITTVMLGSRPRFLLLQELFRDALRHSPSTHPLPDQRFVRMRRPLATTTQRPQGLYGFRPSFSLRDLLRVGHDKFLLPQNETEQWGFQSAGGWSRKLPLQAGSGSSTDQDGGKRRCRVIRHAFAARRTALRQG